MSSVDEVKNRLDIVEVIGKYTPLTKAGRNFKAVCPFHSEKTPSFFVFPEKQSWHCFGACSTGGDAISFVMKKEAMTFSEALRFLADKVGVLLPTSFQQVNSRDEKERLFQANEVASQFYHNQLVTSADGKKTREYLAKRGLNEKTISAFQLGYSPHSWESLKQYMLARSFTEIELLNIGLLVQSDDGRTHDRFRDKLMFPIHDQRGRTTGFGSRALDNSLPKYINSPQTPVFDKSDTLYGIDLATNLVKSEDRVVIVEGYFDVILAHQNGFGNVVASMGVAITDKQVTKLKRLTTNLVLSLDPDSAGEESMLRCIDYENARGVTIKVIILPDGKDPDEVIIENAGTWRSLVENAATIIDFTIEKKTVGLNLASARDKSMAVNNLIPVIARVQDDIRRDHYLTKLSKLTGISYNKLEDVLIGFLAKPPSFKPRTQTVSGVSSVFATSPREDYCLALLLRFPELKTFDVGLLPEHFQETENREIYSLWLETDDILGMKEKLDSLVREKLEKLLVKEIPRDYIADKFTDCALILKKDYLQGQQSILQDVYQQELEVYGKRADLLRLQREGIAINEEIRQISKQLKRRARKLA